MVHLRQHPLCARQHPCAGGRERDLPGGAIKDADAERSFQARDRSRDSCLGHTDLRGRVGERARLVDGHQGAELTELHIHTLSV